MARRARNGNQPPAVENIEATINTPTEHREYTLQATPDDHYDIHDELVEVEYFDGSTFTFDLHLKDRKVSFVNGKAIVTKDVAKALRDGGYVK